MENKIYGGYLYDIGDLNGVKFWIDAQKEDKTNKGRYINHPGPGENANLLPQLFYNGQKPEVWFKATKEIDAGQELLFDYGETDQETIEANPWLKQ